MGQWQPPLSLHHHWELDSLPCSTYTGKVTPRPHPSPGPSQPPLTFDVLHLTQGDRVEIDLHQGPQEVGVGHHALGGFPVKLLVAFHDEDALTNCLHLLWGLRK